jgi:ABC-2 type transport system permease protein
VLILQQTLLMSAAMLTGGALRASGAGALTTVLGRGAAHVTMYLPAMALYFIVLPRLYGFSALGQVGMLFAFGGLFILATSFMAQAVGAWFKHRETSMLLLLATSIPQLFVVGFAWPREAIPESVLTAGHIFPSDFAILGLIRLNQMGADLSEIATDWRRLGLMTAVYFAIAVVSAAAFKWRRGNA